MTREEAIEFGNMWLQISEDCKNSSTYAFFQMAIKALSQEPKTANCNECSHAKTGHWIYDRTRDWDGECKYECSCCGMGSDVDYAYCMRCGARMFEL